MISRYKRSKKKPFEWIDIANPTKEELALIAKEFSLHGNSVQDSLQPEHLPKFERIDKVDFIIMRVYDPHCSREADTVQEISRKIALFISTRFIITIHRTEQPILSEIKSAYFDTGLCKSPNEVLIKILYAVFQSYRTTSGEFENQLDHFESQFLLRNTSHGVLKKLYHLKRKTAVCLRILRLSRLILDNISPRTTAPVLQDLHELYISLETSYEQLIENTNNLLNLYVSLSSHRTNEVVRILTLFSVFFMPLTFIVGIYGMNFDFMPELRHPLGYPAVLLFMAFITGIIYFWFKKKGWL